MSGRRSWSLAAAASLFAMPAALGQAPAGAVSGAGAWAVALAGAGFRGGRRDLGARAGLEAALGGAARIGIDAEGWAGTGDCLTAEPGPEPTAPCAAASGWAVRAGLALAVGGGRVSGFVAPGLGLAGAGGTRPLAGFGVGLDLAGDGPLGMRVEGRYARLFGAPDPDRLTLAAGLRVRLSARGAPAPAPAPGYRGEVSLGPLPAGPAAASR